MKNTSSTLRETLDTLAIEILQDGIVLPEGVEIHDEFTIGGINYNERKSAHYPIASIKGRNTRKYLHVVINRLVYLIFAEFGVRNCRRSKMPLKSF